MRVLVNGLSIGSLSGRHVLFGHLAQLAKWTRDQHEFLVLHRQQELLPVLGENVSFLIAPPVASHWMTRTLWESQALPRLIRQQGIEVYFTPAGTVLTRCPVPQVSLAQNPWCLMKELHRHRSERLKARLQRMAYRQAMIHADLMAYNSQHMQALYRQNAPGLTEKDSIIAHQGINDETHQAAARLRAISDRDPFTILSVSVMAPWKGADTLVDALSLLQSRDIPARLQLVGPWPDRAYEQAIRDQIRRLGLHQSVEITGKVSVEELHRRYASSRVFCLLSHCESFGIPAIEAQSFGTPVVGSEVCAMPEICGEGGVFGLPGCPQTAADLLEPMLVNEDTWKAYSIAAVANAENYRWERCSRPLLRLFNLAG